MSRVAAVDCGTNSIRLLVADVGGDSGGAAGPLADVAREMRVVRLGQGVDATGAFVPEAIARTRVALEEYAGIIADTGATSVRMVATSATRDAANRDEFFDMTAEVLGAVIPGAVAEVISGDEEAELSFAGAVGELGADGGPFAVVDLGGGSTEIVLGDDAGVHAARSSDIGCVRLTERCLPGDPPGAGEVADAEEFIAERFAAALDVVPVERARTWVGVAGTMTTIAAIALGLDRYDPERIHLARIPFDRLRDVCDRLVAMTREERAALPVMHPGRVDVIGGGALITRALARVFEERAGIGELVVSEHDILDGIALSIG
ncbi:Ppx/GppA phosphatase family protein [Tomitella fengzijianii]|uniref:Exopolyphosphatase 2 n=1 Tax=Tomitella fengzijianii TaxID=2597660 RepID=A0A516X1Y4_9ACTN|nr:Ppx/GppA phosphatase family protein [Tomitella fengzijianii]QDQ97095.1 Ppx/GppA family phosphatase [Tomitella fengzijianii]